MQFGGRDFADLKLLALRVERQALFAVERLVALMQGAPEIDSEREARERAQNEPRADDLAELAQRRDVPRERVRQEGCLI